MKKNLKEINAQEELKKGLDTITKKSTGFISEFKQFIAKGNVMDLAVGVIIGTAFSNIVKSLTDNILMPVIGAIIGGIDFSNLSVPIKIWKESIDLNYGLFIQSTVDFLLTAFCIFIMVKIINGIFRKKEEEKASVPASEPKKSDEVLLLEEIRDLLKENKKAAK